MNAREEGSTKLEEDSCTVEGDLILYPHTNRLIGETASSSQEIKILTVAYRFKVVQDCHAALTYTTGIGKFAWRQSSTR